jgi:hypothetical protein
LAATSLYVYAPSPGAYNYKNFVAKATSLHTTIMILLPQ